MAATVTLTEDQEAFARDLIAQGRFTDLSAVLQYGLDLVRNETEMDEEETAALRALLEERSRGPFISMEESSARLERMIAAELEAAEDEV